MGMSIAANKFRGIYAARCTTVEDAELARTINNANVLCLAAKHGFAHERARSSKRSSARRTRAASSKSSSTSPRSSDALDVGGALAAVVRRTA